MKYTDGADHMDEECKNEVVGFVFYYPQIARCNVIEIEIENEAGRNDVAEFERWLCQILFVVNEQTAIISSTSREIM
jgi:hypothetical protein